MAKTNETNEVSVVSESEANVTNTAPALHSIQKRLLLPIDSLVMPICSAPYSKIVNTPSKKSKSFSIEH